MSEDSGEMANIVKKTIERNRQKAIILKRSKLVSHPYNKGEVCSEDTTTTLKIGTTKYKDTGGGFLLEENDEPDELELLLAQEEAPILELDRPECGVCNKTFASSWLFDKFDYKCCDACKDPETHKLITKTEAKTSYLLKDCDLDKREPQLKFIQQKNPHNSSWGDMKLYLLIQIEKRALEIWGSEENLEKERELREEKRVLAKSKKYEKQLKELRKGMRSSLYDRTKSASHTHEFGEETLIDEEEDTYHRKCLTCPYEETFEKM
ncbi:DNA repair protein complementing XP-A cells homolog [Diabrotica virgifera virgifera]|uniref:DNA repair protein complementing XP-A cells homolog n=1 Tax=Diabrotica virgifera virgifera TaxID=50390 RepID=A0A6P7GLH8_DIAVI|nr:DNA repair protein complementing XP-A cells homolog [Diabrotica virgifera virgifera]